MLEVCRSLRSVAPHNQRPVSPCHFWRQQDSEFIPVYKHVTRTTCMETVFRPEWDLWPARKWRFLYVCRVLCTIGQTKGMIGFSRRCGIMWRLSWVTPTLCCWGGHNLCWEYLNDFHCHPISWQFVWGKFTANFSVTRSLCFDFDHYSSMQNISFKRPKTFSEAPRKECRDDRPTQLDPDHH